MKNEELNMTAKSKKADKPPLICRMCKAGLVKYFCKVCPPVSAADLPMTEEEAHVLNMNMRYDSEAAGIVSNIDPETEQRMVKLNQEINEYKKKKEDNERAEYLANCNHNEGAKR